VTACPQLGQSRVPGASKNPAPAPQARRVDSPASLIIHRLERVIFALPARLSRNSSSWAHKFAQAAWYRSHPTTTCKQVSRSEADQAPQYCSERYAQRREQTAQPLHRPQKELRHRLYPDAGLGPGWLAKLPRDFPPGAALIWPPRLILPGKVEFVSARHEQRARFLETAPMVGPAMPVWPATMRVFGSGRTGFADVCV
jgi:hypothetical protein